MQPQIELSVRERLLTKMSGMLQEWQKRHGELGSHKKALLRSVTEKLDEAGLFAMQNPEALDEITERLYGAALGISALMVPEPKHVSFASE